MDSYMKLNKGFTLIELMIVVAVIAIISAIAVPAYFDQINRGKRADAKAGMLDLVGRQERYYTQNVSYTSALTDLAATSASPKGLYTLSMTAAPSGCSAAANTDNCISFVITATPTQTDAKCATLTYSSTGVKGSTGTGTVDDCWR